MDHGGDAGNWTPSQENADGKRSTSTHQPQGTNPKPKPNVLGERYQCPRCPKNFSRIENLTRHQANHDDVGKFACLICRKRFTRSDLLNRHRKIHGNLKEPAMDHVIESNKFSEPFKSENLGLANLVGRESSKHLSQEVSNTSNGSIQYTYQTQVPQELGIYSNQDAYRQSVPSSNPSSYPNTLGQTHGLNSLMEAALAPQETLTFTPLENINPSLWDGFMAFGDNANPYMGSYDADISWTLNHFQQDDSPNMFLDSDLMENIDTQYQQQTPTGQINQHHQHINQYNGYHPANEHMDADADDDDHNDWPDKVSRLNTLHRHAQRVVPLDLNSEVPASWLSVVEEARRSGLNVVSMRPYQQINNQIRASIISTIRTFSFARNDDSSPREVSDRLFPPSEALDYYIRLYFQYIQPRFPILHLPTFELLSCPPLLLLAMMLLGSCHSKADRGLFLRLYHNRLRVACIRMQEVDPKFLRSVDNILTFFLLCFAGTWSGSKQFYELPKEVAAFW